jgi:PIN domain nuclease of toxin-antitoxin system
LGRGVKPLIGHTQHLGVGCDPHLVIDLTFRAFLKSLNLHEVMAGLYGTRLGDQFIEEALILSFQFNDCGFARLLETNVGRLRKVTNQHNKGYHLLLHLFI